ncbi:sugar phosphate isomerase/epimerase family protein [Agrilactobacillus yilanensis]|uniref:Sugar phosphate isomerase/epimerase family protein n=1 Tax=Agrilactobacillus yilanensis TaxID=2485997 RepID=A0ABW4J334_9LACO|nr:sugar phosphate isomerase/epimerase family protein [Agrilactobacillus yilanensis]
MKLGLRAHDIAIFDDITSLAKRLKALNFDYVQFAPRASLPQTTDHGLKINFGLANQVKQTFNQYDIQIAVLGCYINMIHPDLNQRQTAMAQFEQYLATARYFGGNLVGTETGSVDPDFNLTAANYAQDVVALTIQQIKTLATAAEKTGNLLGIEPGVNHPIHSLEVMADVLKQVASPNLQVILDAGNLVTNDQQKINTVIQQALDLFGDKIYAFHVKDYVIEGGRAKVVPVGEGIADLSAALKVIQENQPNAFVILDETPQPHFLRSLSRASLMAATV